MKLKTGLFTSHLPSQISGNVTVWFRDRWSSVATIVASDFFLGTNIVDLAILENQRRYP